MMKKLSVFSLLTVMFLFAGSCTSQIKAGMALGIERSGAEEDLVLLHGLTNKHPWSESFLGTVLSIWGSGNVFVVYTNSSEVTYTKTIGNKKIVYCGENNTKAGDASIEDQVEIFRKKIRILQQSNTLGRKFHILAHSMGGLVARRYIHEFSDTVKGLVTLGTPHHGSPLADSFAWAGFFIGAEDAVENLRPSYLKVFNEKFPVKTAPLADNGKIYTIRGDCDGNDCFGWGGELLFGWIYITQTTGEDNDGLVPRDSALIEGATHIADFPEFDHFDLVRQPLVAYTASMHLLNGFDAY